MNEVSRPVPTRLQLRLAWRAFGLLCALAACRHPATGEGRPPATPGSGEAAGTSLAASVPAPPERRTREAPEARPRKSVPLRFELNGRAFPLPLVHGTVGGEPVWMLVDTGANSHVIAGWVARKQHLPMRPLGEIGSDHAGRAMNAYAVLHARTAIDGWGPIDVGA